MKTIAAFFLVISQVSLIPGGPLWASTPSLLQESPVVQRLSEEEMGNLWGGTYSSQLDIENPYHDNSINTTSTFYYRVSYRSVDGDSGQNLRLRIWLDDYLARDDVMTTNGSWALSGEVSGNFSGNLVTRDPTAFVAEIVKDYDGSTDTYCGDSATDRVILARESILLHPY